jgi:peptidoglycan hydrolase-like protein with peptidoglycan-binding domain
VRALAVAGALLFAFVAGIGAARLSDAPSGCADAKSAVISGPTPEPSWLLVRKTPGDLLWPGCTVRLLLRHHGYDIPVDGTFGERVEAAVKEPQRKNRPGSDGKAGPRSWPVLVAEVGVGDENDAVTALQWLLSNVGRGGTEVTGTFGSTTLEDLRHFRTSHGLRPTGCGRPRHLVLPDGLPAPAGQHRAPPTRPRLSPASATAPARANRCSRSSRRRRDRAGEHP